MSARTGNYLSTALGLLAFSPFLFAIMAVWTVGPFGILLGFTSLIVPCCLAFFCMVAFICLTASRCGPICTRWLLAAGLYGIVVLLVGALGGEGIWTGCCWYFFPGDHFNAMRFQDVPDLARLCASFGFVPAFVLGVIGALICRLPSSSPDA